ncbi:MAG TPA: hypothetical protein VMG31_07590 [Verrucomicrobiae bacterium]|nr:hypothetical protein [Verrucomicrobiae bacterium]
MGRLAQKETDLTDRSTEGQKVVSRSTLMSAGVGLVSFLATELMHYLLVPDLGAHGERWFAEGVSAAVVGFLTAKLVSAANRRREATLLRMQVISEMNHHIRNALAAISLTTDAIQNQQCIQVISESVERIEWALREVLLRPKPLLETEREKLMYLHERASAIPGLRSALAAKRPPTQVDGKPMQFRSPGQPN